MNLTLLKIPNNICKNALPLLLCIGLSVSGLAQKAGLDTLIKKFDDYRKSSLQEKLYVHTDRSYYLTGEIIWFKIYNVDGTFNKPLEISKVAYLEILSAENHPVLQTKIM